MSNTQEAEHVLVVLADPLRWEWNPNAAPRPRWEAEGFRAEYYLWAPMSPDGLDSTPYQREWVLSVHQRDSTIGTLTPLPNTPVPTAEIAKEFCLHHCVTGDSTRIQAARAAVEARFNSVTFREQELAAEQLLTAVSREQRVFSLAFPSYVRGATDISATSKRGKYTAHFDPARRWVVTRTGKVGRVLDEHCFLTRMLAEKACAVHSKTGRWLGMMENDTYSLVM